MLRIKKVRPGVAVFAGFVVVCVGMFFAGYVVSLLPTQQEDCNSVCAKRGLRGELVHIFSAGQTAGMRGQGPMECKCKA